MVTSPSQWIECNSKEGRYAVALPNEPEAFTRTIIEEDRDPPITTHFHFQRFNPEPGIVYEVTWYDRHWKPDELREGPKALGDEVIAAYGLPEALTGKFV